MTIIQQELLTAADNYWEMFMDGAIKFCEFFDAEDLLYETYKEPMVFQRRGVKQGIAHG